MIISRAYPVFDNNNQWGARPQAMGGAFIGIADDVHASIFNPGGLSQIKKKELMYMYARPFIGLEEVNLLYNYISLVIPFNNKGTVGMSWQDFHVSDLYREDTFSISYGIKVNNYIFKKIGPQIGFGINLKYLSYGYHLDQRTMDDIVFANGSDTSSMAVDAGFLIKKLFKKVPNLIVGVTVRNINQPDLGFINEDILLREWGLGIGLLRYKERVNLACDITVNADYSCFYTGLETFFLRDLLIPRAGINTDEMGIGIGSILPFKFGKLRFDYTFNYPFEVKDTNGSHKISMVVKF